MTDRLLLDRLGADGNPPLEQVEVSGWRLRASAGVLLRANSALPLSEALPLDAVVDFYRSRSLPPRVHVSSPALDDALAALGWRREFEVLVMSGPVPTGPSSAVVAPALDEDWLDCWWTVDGRGGPAEQDVLRRMSARVPAPSAYASMVIDGRTVAVGRGVVQEGWLGVYAMAVLPAWRERGLGREVLQGLGSWAAALGAHSVHLQVLADNARARGLYASAGLRPAHGYHYRTLP